MKRDVILPRPATPQNSEEEVTKWEELEKPSMAPQGGFSNGESSAVLLDSSPTHDTPTASSQELTEFEQIG
jgi:hypothetical protein